MRKRIKILLFIIMGILFSNSILFAEVSGVGGGEFLQKGVGARALGMGMAFVALSDDVNALYWNPAGLALISGKEVSSMTTEMFDVKYNYLGYAQRLSKGSIGLGFLRADSDEMEAYDAADPPNFLGHFKYTADAFTISYGKELRERVRMGVSLRYIQQKLYDTSGKGWGMDLGVLYNLNDNLSLGLNLQDIAGTKIKWDASSKLLESGVGSEGAEDKIPLNVKVGVAYRIKEGLVVALDLDKTKHHKRKIHAGSEYWLNENIALRVGADEDKLAAGVGFSLNNWQIDYSYNEHKLGDTSRVSLGYKF